VDGPRHGHRAFLLLLRDDFARIELYEHCAVGFEFFDGDGEAEVVQEEEL
jgi:hypothetical protein